MSLHLYNTMTGRKELFEPLVPDKVTMYVCGPTVYNLAHIGNARPVVVFDTLFRLLQTQFDTVVYARNITDVDDKIIAAAHESGRTIESVTAEFTAKWEAKADELKKLGALVNGDALCAAMLEDFRQVEASAANEILTLSEAARISGYSSTHLARPGGAHLRRTPLRPFHPDDIPQNRRQILRGKPGLAACVFRIGNRYPWERCRPFPYTR